MKIETTQMDLVWFGITTVAVLYLVARTISTLEKISNKVDRMVEHIGMEVDSAIARLSKEATVIIGNLEKNASVCRDNLFQHAQAVELKCYRSKSGIAFGLGPRSSKKKSPSPSISPVNSMNSRTIQPALEQNVAATGCESQPPKKDHHQLVAIHKCIDKVLKLKYRWMSKNAKNKRSLKQATT
ncbi:hypothetical protein SELMODRAFT_419042 [Selaginella moellendorffii]|uniref:Uncharacterized protein n=1 Tax=Selaginella moellendorffii TaxID=88036 RepID=D8S7M7_SELML|nr:hypothetical protein SELMODRAFT_419042 [Selaginella moellendorffii]